MSSSVVKREWLGLEGHIQALNSNCGLSKLKEQDKGDRHWFIMQDSNLLFYDQKASQAPPDTKPTGSINVGSSVVDVIVVISSKEGKDYQLFPPRDVCVFDWVASLKEATRLASKQHSEASFERGAGGGSIMGRLRNSLRRKKKVTRALSDTSKVGSNVNGSASSDATGDHAEDPSLKLETKLKTRVQRSKSFPHEESQIVELKLMPSFNEQEKEPAVEAEEAVSCDPVCENSCEKISVQIPPKDGKIAENEEERKRQPIVTESIEVQTEPITVEELLSFQQQKLIKELEIEVCKLKCEVISLIQGSIKIPLKDDDLADWQLIEDIRYKDRIYQLLREARLYNPSLPNFDSTSASSSFRDSYGFIRGARESESELFHFLCRELKQHYSSFYQNRDGHARLWSQYVKARQQESKDVVFNEQGMKALLREGIPRSCRSEVWRSAMAQKVEHLKKEKGRDYYQKLLLQVERRKNLSANHPLGVTENQIKCDLLRTLPNNERFRSADSEEVKKLSRILHAFCVHRPDINYLQGMNFIVAMCLLFMDEEDAFWSFVAVSEVYLKNYFDKALSGALADQSVLNELLSDLLPALHAHLKYYGVDISTVTFNWFITIFIDAVPFETAMRIWDCFVFEGREALFRIAVGLMKVQQPALLQLSCPLEIMQYMKRAARVTYDKDQLFKSSYEDVKVFPTIETLDEKQAKYLGGADTRLDERSITRDERTRSRVSSFTVEIPNQEKLEKPDQHEILECALATSRDLSSPVCLFCNSRLTAEFYLLDINKKEMKALDVDTKSRVLCCDMLDDGTILVGTVSWYIHAFVLELSSEVWCIQLNDSVIDIAHLPEGKVFAALADGSIAVLQNASGQEVPSEGSHIRVGGSPVTCITLVNENVWCGCGNNVVILDGSSLGELGSLVVSNSRRHQVSKLTHGKHGVWCSVRGSSCILLLDHATFDVLLKVDDVTSLDTSSDSRVIAFCESRVTTMMALGEELWVGLGNGQVLIFDVTRNDKFEDEGYVVLDEHKEYKEKRKESSTKFLPTISETEEKIKEPELTPSIEDSTTQSEVNSSPETVNTCTDEEISSIDEFSESELRESLEMSKKIVDSQNVVNAQDHESQAQNPSGEQIKQDTDMYYSDYRFRLRLRVHFRINEEAIRCLLLVREQDPLVLSCASNFNEEGALSLWQEQRGEETNEWLPFSIKHRFTETAGLFLRGENTPSD